MLESQAERTSDDRNSTIPLARLESLYYQGSGQIRGLLRYTILQIMLDCWFLSPLEDTVESAVASRDQQDQFSIGRLIFLILK